MINGGGYMDPELMRQLMAATQQPNPLSGLVPNLPTRPYQSAVDQNPDLPQTMGSAVGRLISPQTSPVTSPGTLLPAEPGGDSSFGRASSFSQTAGGQPQDALTAVDNIKDTIGLPFRLLNAGANALGDILNSPGAQQREQQKQQLMAIQALPDETKNMLGIPVDRSGIVNAQSGGSAIATGQPSTLGQNVQEPRQTGFFEWIHNLGRDQTQQQLAQYAAQMRATMAAAKMQHVNAETAASLGSAASGFATAGKTGLETDILREYGRVKEAAAIDKIRAERQQALAAAGAQSELGGKYRAETQGVYDTNQRNNQMFGSVTLPSGLESLNQLRTKGTQSADAYGIWAGIQADEQKKTQAETQRVQADIGKTGAETQKLQAETAKVQSDTATGRPSSYAEMQRSLADLQAKDLAYREAYNKMVQGTGPNGAPPVDELTAARRLGIPIKSTPGTFWGTNDAPDLEAWDPVGLKAAQAKFSGMSPTTGTNPGTTTNVGLADPSQRRKPVSIEEWDNEVPKLPTASAARDWIIQNYGLDSAQATSIARAIATARSGR